MRANVEAKRKTEGSLIKDPIHGNLLFKLGEDTQEKTVRPPSGSTEVPLPPQDLDELVKTIENTPKKKKNNKTKK